MNAHPVDLLARAQLRHERDRLLRAICRLDALDPERIPAVERTLACTCCLLEAERMHLRAESELLHAALEAHEPGITLQAGLCLRALLADLADFAPLRAELAPGRGLPPPRLEALRRDGARALARWTARRLKLMDQTEHHLLPALRSGYGDAAACSLLRRLRPRAGPR